LDKQNIRKSKMETLL